ncbi:TolB protein [Pseudochelatococcus lubricantis]|uniref:Tol-Pal system protein TolB n=2 Tax=Pseudochelatococcus lubricantis TaxID=1538102 RepID=A0ABX0V2T9_9HYPH|nr:TolB protein [Pseudochelatococcus lubricantis]
MIKRLATMKMKFLLSRIAAALLAMLPVGLTIPAARAEISITLNSATFAPLPIAVVDFSGDPEVAAGITEVITANLRRIGYFAPLDPSTFIEKSVNFDAVPDFASWQSINAQGLVTGRAVRESGGRIRVEFRLWDVFAGQQLAGQQFYTDPVNWRRIGHIISDAVLTRVTGLKGMFDTRVVFVDETGSKENRRKRLAVMDQDGGNLRYLTRGEELVVSPRFSPVSQEVAFMSQRLNERTRVQLLNIETGQREVVGSFPDMTSSPQFAPDGQRVVLSLQQGGNANIYAINLRSRTTTRVTSTNAIDTSPSFSPDGSRVVFESDRGGGPQIYVMGADGSGQQRVSFGEGRYSQPVWSPRGDYIAFTRQRGGQFAIGIMKPDGSGERILTEGFHNESPTWAPNGQFIMFFSDPGGQGGGRLYMVDVTGRVRTQIPTPSYASDPAWSPLLSDLR